MLKQLSWGLIVLVSLTAGSLPPEFALEPPPLPREHMKDANITQVVESFHVRSDIRYRFATTQMSSVVRNVDSKAQEIGFDVTLPKEAFIVAFHMTIDGKRYDGEVKERLKAKREYQAAVDRGQSAGHVRQAPRHANVFEVTVNVAAGSAVNFTLSYQEILRRRLGLYEHEIHVNPGQPVQDFRVEVHIRENRPLKFVRTPALRTNYLLTNVAGGREVENELTIVDRPTPETATVLYTPSVSEQGRRNEGQGVSARFAVQYDVEHAGDEGDVLVVDGYFVHFLAPDDPSQALPKDIIFVLDVSGSMHGEKIHQLKVAMKTILSDLRPKDRLNIITFSSGITKWQEGLVHADAGNIATAKSYVTKMRADGVTNINDALLSAVSEMQGRHNKERVGMIFFLTDGHPTEGETDPNKIARNIMNANERTVTIFSLAFGEGADYDALKSLSAQNLGFARKIYEASDAALQVASLYNEISAVAVKDLNIDYQNSSVDAYTLTQTDFPIVFNGSEIMVCGMLKDKSNALKYEIRGVKSSGVIDMSIEVESMEPSVPNSEEPSDNLFTGSRDYATMVERMWAYTTIKQLLRQKETFAGDENKIKEIDAKILDMSLEYKFVTPVTSMVVTQPDKGETEIKETKPEDMDARASPNSAKQSHAFYQSVAQPNQVPPPYHSPRMAGFAPVLAPLRPSARGRSGLRKKLSKSRNRSHKLSVSTPLGQNATNGARNTSGSVLTHSVLSLVKLTAVTGSQSICMVPKKWKYFETVLLERSNTTRVILTQCRRRVCKKQPTLESLRFESRSGVTILELDGSSRWLYRPSPAFSVSVMSNTKVLVSGYGLNATVEWKPHKNAARYKIHVAVDDASYYTGLMGHLLSQPKDQLEKLSKKRAKKVCKDESTDFSVLINRKRAKAFRVKKSRKNRKSKAKRNRRRKNKARFL